MMRVCFFLFLFLCVVWWRLVCVAKLGTAGSQRAREGACGERGEENDALTVDRAENTRSPVFPLPSSRFRAARPPRNTTMGRDVERESAQG